jgi:hypothetical protein
MAGVKDPTGVRIRKSAELLFKNYTVLVKISTSQGLILA